VSNKPSFVVYYLVFKDPVPHRPVGGAGEEEYRNTLPLSTLYFLFIRFFRPARKFAGLGGIKSPTSVEVGLFE